MQIKHGASKEETADMFRYFITRMLPQEIEMKVTTREEHEVKREWSFCRCHYPGHSYINAKAHLVDSHVRSVHKEMKKDMKTFGWFWGILHTMMSSNPNLTIGEALGQEQFWECRMEGCHQPFQSQRVFGHHFRQAHAAPTQHGWKAQSRRLTQTWKRVEAGRSKRDVRRMQKDDMKCEEVKAKTKAEMKTKKQKDKSQPDKLFQQTESKNQKEEEQKHKQNEKQKRVQEQKPESESEWGQEETMI
jgi:hypothetical protein